MPPGRKKGELRVKQIIIAIDGPAGAGKSTIAKQVAQKLGYVYIDTGAMYRAVTWALLQTGRPFTEEDATVMARNLPLVFRPHGGVNQVFVGGTNVTDAIRTLDVSQNVSKIAAIGGVRTALVELQRKMGRQGGVVMDGRDIGTVVFPKAQLKIFLTATVQERARRRYQELTEKGMACDLKEMEKRIAERDALDENREISPLRCADDAVYLDSTSLSIPEVVAKILELAGKAA